MSDPASTQLRPSFDNDVKEPDMIHSHDLLVRAHLDARSGEAQQCRQGRRLARVIRSGRRAEQLAQQARLAIARTL